MAKTWIMMFRFPFDGWQAERNSGALAMVKNLTVTLVQYRKHRDVGVKFSCNEKLNNQQ